MCLGTFPRLRRSLATSTLYAAVRILASRFLLYRKAISCKVKNGKPAKRTSLNMTIYLNETRRFSFSTRTACLLVLTRSFANIFFP